MVLGVRGTTLGQVFFSGGGKNVRYAAWDSEGSVPIAGRAETSLREAGFQRRFSTGRGT